VGQSVIAALEQINGAAQRLHGAEAGVQTSAQGLTTAAQRFDGLDRELARVVERLQTGLQSFTRQVSEFVSGTDQNMAKAATQLHGAIKQLEDALEDYGPVRPGAVRSR
jgi:uncharacterized phage infection (PIP) family protein YhgE